MTTVLSLRSPGKINFGLDIIRKRPDGFHELESLMVPLDVCDEMEFEPRDAGHGITMECDAPGLPTNSGNLVIRAAELLQRQVTVSAGAHIKLRKRLPIAAGMGGGSGNGAVALTGLNQLWQLGLTRDQLQPIAATLGSDCALFLDPKPSFCHGRGELVEALSEAEIQTLRTAHFVLINPGFGISTKWAYEQVRPFLTGRGGAIKVIRDALAGGDLPAAAHAMVNTLEGPALRKYPMLELLKESLARNGCAGSMMSGSGATVFGVATDRASAECAMAAARAEFGDSMWMTVASAF
ncbi:MAG: 4-(cytidine 5'-diphospho)-2-C-methyl-D-erythritol kinase [Verrucomicrobia bacterium]|nr:4-(cytidine 5'-diphospho)-2-C-methyl-D-erythritol kinase [Verrucomicrobiota bacterium]